MASSLPSTPGDTGLVGMWTRMPSSFFPDRSVYDVPIIHKMNAPGNILSLGLYNVSLHFSMGKNTRVPTFHFPLWKKQWLSSWKHHLLCHQRSSLSYQMRGIECSRAAESGTGIWKPGQLSSGDPSTMALWELSLGKSFVQARNTFQEESILFSVTHFFPKKLSMNTSPQKYRG